MLGLKGFGLLFDGLSRFEPMPVMCLTVGRFLYGSGRFVLVVLGLRLYELVS